MPTLANVSWVAKPTVFPKVDGVSIPFKKEIPVTTFWTTGTTKKTFPVDKNMLQERRREMSPNKKDPVLDFFNSNAPEWLRIDPEDVDILAQLAKEDYPDLSGQERIQKAVEYLPDLLLSKQQNQPQQPVPKQQLPMQWGIRRWTAGINSLDGTMLEWLEPINKTADKFNPIWQFTQFIDDTVQKIPTISRESMAKALNWTPFEWMEVLPTMVANAPWSLLKTASATARGITNPFDAIVWLSKLVMTPEWRKAIIDRYGSVEWLKQSLTEDPVGMASDALTLLQWWARLSWKWARMAWFADEASKLSNISKVAWSAADLGLSTAIPKWLQKVTQLWDNLWQKGLLWQAWQKVVQWLVSWTQPLQTAKDAYWVVQEAKPIEYIASKILWTTEDQWKLFQAQEPRLWQLNKSIDYKKLRENSDIANTEIVNAWYKPTDTASRAEAHANTMQKIWDNEIKARIGTEYDIDLNSVADVIDDFVAKQSDAGLVKNKWQLAELTAQAKEFRRMGTVDGAKGEFIKEMINSQINNRWDSSIGDVYKNGMKDATRQLWKNLDDAFSRIPWEFADAKRRFGALKATYTDVVKADLKAQKAKWLWLTETFSRIEWFGDILWGIWGMIVGKNPIPEVLKGWAKLLAGKVLKKLKDNDFLIQEWFEWLSKTATPQSQVIKAQTNRKALPMKDWMQFESPKAQIGSSTPRGYDITETGMENVRQPWTPLVKSIAQPVAKKTPLVKATDTQKLSPKVKKPLIKAEVASKVDDALPVWEKMWNTTQSAKSLDSADLTTSIKKAKAEGKTFDEFVSSQEKEGKIIYHWTNQVFDKFNDSVLKAKGGQWYSSELWHWFTDSSDEAVEYAKQANKRLMRNQLDFDKKSQDLVDKITLAERQRKFDLAEELTEQLEQLERTAREPWEDIVIKAVSPDNLLKHKVKNNARLMEEQMEVAKKAKAEWYKGVIFEWVSDSPLWAVRESNQTVIFNPKDIKTTSQLRTERDKLDNAWLPALWKPTSKPLVKAKVDDWLIAEARKYKSADEFRRSEPKLTVSIDDLKPTDWHTYESTVWINWWPRKEYAWKPLLVSFTKDGKYQIHDWNHRYFLAKSKGDKDITVKLMNYTPFTKEENYHIDQLRKIREEANRK